MEKEAIAGRAANLGFNPGIAGTTRKEEKGRKKERARMRVKRRNEEPKVGEDFEQDTSWLPSA